LANFLTDETLMSSLTQSAATFVAILAGFYTTKILTIAGDKSRIEHKINYSKSEISFETENIKNLKLEKNTQEEKENQPLQYFVEIIKDKSHFPVFPNINTYDDLIA
jgi:Tfp pilus assembly PilM family ATPase